jgi:uncharacterized protein
MRIAKMDSICLKKRCIACCVDTQMPLSLQDISRIEGLGFAKDYFVVSTKGWLQLKNRDGRCVFHNGTRCEIYDHRPKGCRLYPVIFDYDTKRPVLDEDCPYKEEFSITDAARKELLQLVSRIMAERYKRLF